ncbi:hypothetical protein DLAC_04191 [Tieghemostelium lacteum]|uniref:Lysosomal dipeptide transporter MFSD1 n=1 Tax=Tieghemostelium lacteum TaxID=361077 RepID=A0A151ZSH0_TIELA|nr:hypothetical protein DLAC_04191 [Tieghemostelium lacteum]|eukprot:KYQ96879.1 hypothetical protein DLAC_04191 [Tieghemostelium lacteum]
MLDYIESNVNYEVDEKNIDSCGNGSNSIIPIHLIKQSSSSLNLIEYSEEGTLSKDSPELKPHSLNHLNRDTISDGVPHDLTYYLKSCLLIFLISNLGYSTFFSYTSPEALSHTFYERFQITANQFGSLFTIYAAPNTVMVFLSGVVIDMVGASRVSLVLTLIVTLSTLVGALSVPNFTVMLVSRFLLGFAGESLVACSNTIMSKTFPSRHLPICIGMLVGWIYSANLLSLLLLPALNKSIGFRWSLWVIFFVAALGLSLNIIYLLCKNKLVKIDKTSQVILLENLKNGVEKDGANADEDMVIEEEFNDNSSNVSSTSSLTPTLSIRVIVRKCLSILSQFKEIIIQIPARMWVIIGIVFFGYIGLFGLAIIGPSFLGEKYGFNEQTAALILSSETICSAVFSPICGILIGRFSKKIPILMFSVILMALGLLLLVTTNVFPLYWIIIIGIGYAILNTTVVSSLPLFIPDSILGTCYGLVGTSYNMGLVVFPTILGTLRESSGSYTLSFYVLVASCTMTAFLIALLKIFDLKSPIETRLDVPSTLFKSLQNEKNKSGNKPTSYSHH